MPTPDQLPAIPETNSPDHAGEFHTIANLLLGKLWLIVLCATIGVLLAAYHLKKAPRIYQAAATVQVEEEEKKPVKVDSFMKEDLRNFEILNTIVQKFTSRPLLERVIETNRLAQNPAFVGPGNAGLFKKEDLAPLLQSTLKVGLRRDTRLIDIVVSHTEPKLTADIANSLAEQYMSQDIAFSSTATKGARSYLVSESERLKKKLEDSELTLQRFKEESGFVSLQNGQDVVGPQLRELAARLAQAKTDTARVQRMYDRISQQAKNVENLMLLSVVATNQEVQALRASVNKMDQDFKILSLRYKDKHPKYNDAYCQLDSAKKELATAMTNAVNRALEALTVEVENVKYNEEGFQKELRQAETEALKISQHAIQYGLLLRDLEQDRALFDSVLKSLKETSLAAEQQPERLRLIQSAVVPKAPISPNPRRIYTMGIVGGLLAGILLALGLNVLDTSFKSIEQAEGYLQLPVLTAIPRLKDVREGDSRFVAAEGSTSRGAESFRTLRTSLAMLGREEERRSFLFTSAFPQEGKTFNSINYAITLAQQGLSTLLIDVDLRRPSVEDYITGRKNHLPGVTDYLVGDKAFADIIQTNPSVKKMHWISAGRSAPNPAELLAQGTFFKLLDEAMEHYDRVVIDSAPIHAVSDTLLISNRIQTTVLIVNGRRTPRKPVLRSLQLLRNAGGNPGGIILNMLPVRWGRGGYGYYYDGYYYYHGGYKGYGYGEKPAKKSKGESSHKPEQNVQA